MQQWPHAPLHWLHNQGAYMVTAGTYQKIHHFKTPERLTLLHDSLLQYAQEFGWGLRAWAVFSNHYHFVGVSPADPGTLRPFLTKLHGTTAKTINELDGQKGRKVWHQYWDSHLSHQRSFLARLNYVQQNPVRHKLVDHATEYVWCSASWFERAASPTFVKTVKSFKIDNVNVYDEY